MRTENLAFLRTLLECCDQLQENLIDDERDSWQTREDNAGHQLDYHYFLNDLPARLKDGANLIDLWVEMRGLFEYLEDKDRLDKKTETQFNNDFWNKVDLTIKGKL